MAVRNQYITIGAGYPVAVNVAAVESVMDIYKTSKRDQVFRRVTNVINRTFVPKLQRKFEK